MSLYNKASIVLAPGAYKEGRIFNQKPLSYASDLKFDRGTASSVQTREANDGNITSVGLDIPRINYLGNDGGYLLMEPQSINVLTYSNNFNQNSTYTAIAVPQRQANQVISPTGDLTGTLLKSGNPNFLTGLRINENVVSGSDYTFSFFAKKKDLDYMAIQHFNTNSAFSSSTSWFNIDNGTLGTVDINGNDVETKIEDYGNGWYRCSATQQATATAQGRVMMMLATGDSITTAPIDSGSYIFGAQFEQQSFSTSYIPTDGSTETRAAETAIDAGGDENLFGQTEGVLYVEMAKFENDGSTGQVSISSDNTDNVVSFKAITSNRFQMQLRAGGGAIKTVTSSNNISDNTNFNKYAISYKSGEIKIFANGSQIGSTGTETFSFSSNIIFLKLNSGNEGNDNFKGKIKCISVFKQTLTDTELQELTS